MRKLIGYLVLIIGIGGLGWVATTTHALRIEQAVASGADAVARTAPHGLRTEVSGRDLRVRGTLTDVTEYAAMLERFEAIDGLRTLDFSGVGTLPFAAPYALVFMRPRAGAQTLSGVIPNEAARAALLTTVGGDVDVTLTLAAGVPDDDWIDVATRAIAATADMSWAAVTLSDRTITAQGLVATASASAPLEAVLADLPQGYTAALQIDVEDVGAPLRLTLSLRDGTVTGTGRFPQALPVTTVTGLFAVTGPLDITQAINPQGDAAWPDMARTAMQALAALTEADLMIEDTRVVLNGTGTPDGKAQAEALLATLPAQYEVSGDIGLWDDGEPLQINVEWDGAGAGATGKLPEGFSPPLVADVQIRLETQQGNLPDPDGDFTRHAQAGIAALGLLDTGRMTATETAITLTGTATSAQAGVAVDDALAQVADSATISRDISYLDDGSPAAWTLTFNAVTGASVEGRLPAGLSVQDVTDALGIPVQGATATAAGDGDTTGGLDTLAIVADYLPELDSLTYVREAGVSAMTLIVAPGVDLDLVALDLAERLPTDVAFSLGPLTDLPPEGTTRENAITGMQEAFVGGFWLPSLDFTADVAGCTAQAEAVLATSEISFLSGADRLDATSIRAINALAAVARPCIDADLTLEIGGHTDATGAPQANDILSLARATAVLNALVSRGLSADAMFATGYGQSQPIADNDTPEGRAANRRTSLTWLDPQTP